MDGAGLSPARQPQVTSLTDARSLLRESEAMKATARQKAPRGRRLRVGLLSSAPDRLAAGVLRELARLLPTHACQAEDAALEPMRKRLASGRLDLALTILERSPAPG